MNQSKTNSIPGLAKRSLSAHTWLGLAISALMYVICLSGTLAVFHHELERWEQPYVAEITDFEYDQVETAYNTFVAQYPEQTSHMHLVFPLLVFRVWWLKMITSHTSLTTTVLWGR